MGDAPIYAKARACGTASLTHIMENWKPRFFLIWTGQAFSLFGSALVQFALIWWLTMTTGSATVLATASLAGMLPQVVLGLIAGTVVDRGNRRVIMMAADAFGAVTTALLAWLFFVGLLQPWHVYVAMALRSAAAAFHFPAMQASTSLMVPNAQLSRVAGMNQALQGASSIVAPALGALVISLLPMHSVMMIDVVTAALAILPLLFVAVPNPPKAEADEMKAAPSIFGDMRAGLRFVLNWRALSLTVLLALAVNFVLTPGGALIPILVTRHFGGAARDLAIFEAAWGAGMIAGGVLLSVWGGFKSRIATAMCGLTGIGLGFVLGGFAPAWAAPLGVAGLFITGVSNPITNGPFLAIVQSAVPPDMQGRVNGLLISMSVAVAPISLAVAGPVADALGVRFWFVLGGGVCMALAGLAWLSPTIRNIEHEARDRASVIKLATNPV